MKSHIKENEATQRLAIAGIFYHPKLEGYRKEEALPEPGAQTTRQELRPQRAKLFIKNGTTGEM